MNHNYRASKRCYTCNHAFYYPHPILEGDGLRCWNQSHWIDPEAVCDLWEAV